MKSLRIVGILAAAFALPLLFGCTQSSNTSGGRVKVAFVSNNPAPFWSIAEKGTEKAAKEFDVDVVFKKPNQGDAAVQQELIDGLLLDQAIKGIAVSVIDPKNQGSYLNNVSKKVSLFTQDNDTLQDDPARKTGRLCYIGTNNYEAGRAAGRMVSQAMPEGGEVAIFVGDVAPLNAQQRRDGVLDELAGAKNAKGPTYGKYHLHKIYTDQPDGETRAKENALSAIAELDELIRAGKPVCFVGLWAYNPPMILSAVKDKKVEGKVKIVAFDEDFATLDGIRDGFVEGTIVQQPYMFGYESVRLMAAVARGDRTVLPADGRLYVPHFAVTKEGKPMSTKEGTDLPALKVEGKTAEFWKKDLTEKTGNK
jgi:ribose transport system substrate-binding protein